MQNNLLSIRALNPEFLVSENKKKPKKEKMLYFTMPQNDYNYLYTCEKYFYKWDYIKDLITVKIPIKFYNTIVQQNYKKFKTNIRELKLTRSKVNMLTKIKNQTKREVNRRISIERRIKMLEWNIKCLKRGVFYHLNNKENHE